MGFGLVVGVRISSYLSFCCSSLCIYGLDPFFAVMVSCIRILYDIRLESPSRPNIVKYRGIGKIVLFLYIFLPRKGSKFI